ncbi:hypothetical protein Ga0466249_002364 [Sporomusaceae bacterium BoRhaA]|uniref:DUF2642 domain-containing protein n=1 Tax=Pelorhabdus rhamnosifermentans TaxID=2772457 RepID=UPI001C060EB3|nr:DUF2642 domain-containing protein [Pelorhabdus rhamnosifermentans]MBU2701250.1 hypothetical protein [Pelorhabdus rhamnosifermentans]
MKYRYELPEMITPVEPSWLKRLISVMGMEVVVETTRNSLYGKLLEVEHDHIELQIGHRVTFIRCQQIISVMPIPRC